MSCSNICGALSINVISICSERTATRLRTCIHPPPDRCGPEPTVMMMIPNALLNPVLINRNSEGKYVIPIHSKRVICYINSTVFLDKSPNRIIPVLVYTFIFGHPPSTPLPLGSLSPLLLGNEYQSLAHASTALANYEVYKSDNRIDSPIHGFTRCLLSLS